MRVLVTGGAGFIGSHLVDSLAADGHSVLVLDNLSTGKLIHCEKASMNGDVNVKVGDIVRPVDVEESMEGADVVVHLAALTSVADSMKDPRRTTFVNVVGTVNVLDAARRFGVKRVVFASSAAVYGDAIDLPIHESDSLEPLSPYAVSKLTGENYCRMFSVTHGLDTVCLRLFNVYGPRQDPNSSYAAVIPLFIAACQAGKSPIIYGDGNQSRDFVNVKDVVRAIRLSMESASSFGGTSFNIASGKETPINHLANLIRNAVVCKGEPPYHAAARAGDIQRSLASIEKAEVKLGYHRSVHLADGLLEIVR